MAGHLPDKRPVPEPPSGMLLTTPGELCDLSGGASGAASRPDSLLAHGFGAGWHCGSHRATGYR